MIFWLIKRKLLRRLRPARVTAPVIDPREKHFASRLIFGMMGACASPKDSADLARGTAWVLRNELGAPIKKVTLTESRDTTLWERVEDGISPEVVIALRGQALRAGRHPSLYGI